MLQIGFAPLPGYRLVGHLGTGGFGDVWEAIDPRGERVAMKFLNCRHMPGQMVANEVRHLVALRELEHPNLIRLLSVSAAAQYVILTMELAEGSLADLHELYFEQTGGPIPSDHLLELLGQAAEALDFLSRLRVRRQGFSASGLQHCDVKPSNLLILGNQLKVADFGLCGRDRWGEKRRGFMGTPPYAPPELYEGRISERTDQYSLAVTFCELAIGERVFEKPATSRGDRFRPVLNFGQMREAERLVLARALDPKAMNRWPDCTTFIRELRKAVETPRSASRLTVAGRRRPAAVSTTT